MVTLFFFFSGVCALFLAFILLEPFTRRCRARMERYRPLYEAWDPSPAVLLSKDTPPPHPESPPFETSVPYHFQQILRSSTLLGLCALPVLALMITINCLLLAEGFSILLDRHGIVLGEMLVAGISVQITDLQLYGFALALALLLLGAWYNTARHHGNNESRLLLFCLGALVVMETGVSSYRGYLITEGGPHPFLFASLSALQGLVCALTEGLAGAWVLDRGLVPIMQSLTWICAAPVRRLWHWLVRRRRYRLLRGSAWFAVDPPSPGALVCLGAWLDESLFDLLRQIDCLVALPFQRPAQKEIPHGEVILARTSPVRPGL